jgi:hypothetical protein
MARYQNLSINQTKLSGQCGRLKCCLNYELDTYLDALQYFPEHVDVLETAKGRAHLIKKDIFKNLMWYTLPDSNKQYPLNIETVREIKAMNDKGMRPEELETADVNTGSKVKEVEPQFVDVVGQISLRSLDRNAQKRKGKGSREQGAGTREKGVGLPAGRQGIGNREQQPRTKPVLQSPSANQPAPKQATDATKPILQINREQTSTAPRNKPSIEIKKGDQS